MKPFAAALIVVAALAAGCGGGGEQTSTARVPGGADPEAVQVIDDWAISLTHGDIDAAASYFALPSVATNGTVFQIRDLADARRFNASLPCGATLIRAEPKGELIVATFRLTERAGGLCGSGAGHTAKTAFAIDDEGKITQWRRVFEGPGGGGVPAPGTSA